MDPLLDTILLLFNTFSLIHYIHSAVFLHSSKFLPHFLSSLPQISSSSVSLGGWRRRTGLPGISTLHDLRRYKRLGTYHCWMWQPSRRKWVPKGGKRVRDTPHCWEHRNTKLQSPKVYAENLAQSHTRFMGAVSVSVSPRMSPY